MLQPEEVVRRLRESGSLWDVAPGVTGLSGRVAALEREIEQALADIARAETPNEWRSPAGVSFETLERAATTRFSSQSHRANRRGAQHHPALARPQSRCLRPFVTTRTPHSPTPRSMKRC